MPTIWIGERAVNSSKQVLRRTGSKRRIAPKSSPPPVDDSAMHGQQPASGDAAKGTSLRSEFADDPDMREIVEFFVNDLSTRIDAIRAAFDTDDRSRLKTLAHQLKGAAGGYGFPTIGFAAADVERELIAAEADIAAIDDKVDELLRLCRAALAPRS